VGVGCGLQGDILQTADCSEARREISYWAVRSEGACQARPQCMESLEWRWKAVREPSRFQIPDPRRAGVSVGVVGEAWLGLLEACRLEIAEGYPWVLLEMRRYGTEICEMSEACRMGEKRKRVTSNNTNR